MEVERVEHVEQRVAEFDAIPAERKEKFDRLAEFVRPARSEGKIARLTFICTHNSRRCHMSQVWAQTAAAFYGIDGVETFSGGTEATEFNPRAVAALERAGLEVDRTTDGDNWVYEVRFAADGRAIRAFSKVHDEDPNPSADFCAVMTCSQADATCPIVPGSRQRLSVPYEDPKAFDGTDREADAYDERCRQIGREMLYALSRIARG